jgi:hypothetical protein
MNYPKNLLFDIREAKTGKNFGNLQSVILMKYAVALVIITDFLLPTIPGFSQTKNGCL